MVSRSFRARRVFGLTAGAVVALAFLGAGCSSSDEPVPCCTGGPLLVRTASGGTLDVAGTEWADCRPNEPVAGMSRRKASVFGAGTFTAREDVFTGSTDCTGAIDPALAMSVTAQTAAQGDREVGWDDAPPPELATTVTATAVLLHGFTPGPIPDLKTLLFVDDGVSPEVLYKGGEAGTAPDGYPTTLNPFGAGRTAP